MIAEPGSVGEDELAHTHVTIETLCSFDCIVGTFHFGLPPAVAVALDKFIFGSALCSILVCLALALRTEKPIR